MTGVNFYLDPATVDAGASEKNRGVLTKPLDGRVGEKPRK